MSILTVSNLKKRYGDRDAVKGVSFSVASGEIVGLLGPNGAGKTTTISMILGILSPEGGTITIAGHDISTARSAALSSANFAAVYAQLPGNLTIEQNLTMWGLIYSVPHLAERIGALVRDMNLDRFRHTKAGLLSSGEQTRLALAKAFLNEPQLLLLDEPTASLDPSSAQIVREKIRAYAKKGGGVLWTSHNMQEVTEMCDRVLFISHGSILLEGNPRTLPQEHGKKDLEDLFITVAREPLSLEL